MKMLQSLFSPFLPKHLGIDLGTANTLVHLRGKGILLREPSVIAIDKIDNSILAVGSEAKRMLGRTPANIIATRPLKDGVIADFNQTHRMLKYFIHKIIHHHTFLSQATVIIGIPSGITEVEKMAIKEASQKAGAKHTFLIEEPMAAAIGSDLPVADPTGNMIVDIGGGTTEVAVISLGGIVNHESLRTAGDEIDEAIESYIRRSYNLLIGSRTAEEIKISTGSAYPCSNETEIVIRGRDLFSGLPQAIKLHSGEIREAITEPLNEIVHTIESCLEHTPPELASDIMEHGITLSGGGSLLKGIDTLISSKTHIKTHISPDPLGAVVLGTAKILDESEHNSEFKTMLLRHSEH
ncbi:MAG: rod shape-determining protein [Armatimonadetes bacterium]|nr:rod shape-determining protein [Armatimonadota bacterium]